jgi:hypothetical protein
MLIFLQQTNVTRVAHSSIPKAVNIMILVALIQIVEIGLGNRKWPIFFFSLLHYRNLHLQRFHRCLVTFLKDVSRDLMNV